MRENLRFIAVGLSLMILAGCSDSANIPSAPTRSIAAAAPAFDYSSGGSFGDRTADYTVTSRGGSFSVNGLFTVDFPANSVCNPDRSTYGATEWDKPCSTLRDGESIKIRARISLTPHGLGVDFSPELRFNPNTTVTISTDIFAPVLRSGRDYFLSHPGSLNFLAVSYIQALGASPIADYRSDHSLITTVDLGTGKIWRRIKHFSGYYNTNGEACVPSPDLPDCVFVDDGKDGDRQ